MLQFLAAALILGTALTEIRFSPGFDLKSLKGQPAKLTLKENYCAVDARKPDRFCTFRLPLDVEWSPDLVLTFDYRSRLPGGVRLTAFAVGVFTDRPKVRGYVRLEPGADWTSAKVDLGACPFPAGTKITHVTIYNRIADKDPAAVTGFDIRDIRLERAPRAAAASAGLAGAYVPNRDLQSSDADGRLRLMRTSPARGFTAEFAFPKGLPVRPGQRFVLPYRILYPVNGTVNTVVVRLRYEKATPYSRQVSVSPQWTGAVLPVGVSAPDKLAGMTFSASITPREPKAVFGVELGEPRIEPDPEYVPGAAAPENASALPFIDWKPGKPGTVYTATVTSEETPERSWSVETTRHYCVPSEPLAPGVYRFRVTDGKSTVASGRWRILPDAHRWRFPAYDFAKIAASPHPRLAKYLRVRYPDPAAARSAARAWLGKPMPDPPEVYREGGDPAVKSWIVWYARIAGDVTHKTGTRLERLAAAALYFPEDKRYAEEAVKVLMTVVRDWDPEGGSHPKHADLAASALVRGMALVYDVCHDKLSPGERRLAAAAIRRRGQLFRDRIVPIGSREGNHCWDNVRATAAVAVALADEPDMAVWFDYAAYLFAYKFLPGRGFDGESEEGLYYWSYGFGNAAACMDLLKHSGGPDLYRQPWARVTARFPVYCAAPEGYKISFADNASPNQRDVGPHRRDFVAKLALEAGDPVGMWYAGQVPADGPVPEVPLGIEQSKLFRHIGVAAFNTFLADGRENVALGFHSGTYFGNHQHADQNSFVICAYGDKLAIDGGCYDWWGSQHFLRYSVRSEAHNTVLVNGAGQSLHVKGADGRITGFFDSPEFGYVAGDGSKAFLYGGLLTKFSRRIFFLKPDHVIVYDQLAAPADSTFSFLLHSHTAKPIGLAGNAFGIVRPRAALTGAMYLPENVKTRVEKSYTIEPDEGRTGRKVRRSQPEWTLFAENPAPSRATEFLAAMRISRAGAPALKPDWKKVETADYVALENSVYRVVFNRHPGREITYLGRKIAGDGAAFRLDAVGKVVSEAIPGVTPPGGTALAGRSGTILLSGKPIPVTRYVRPFPDGRAVHAACGILESPRFAWLVVRRKAPGRMPLNIAVSSAGLRIAREIPAGAVRTMLPVEAGKSVFTFDAAEAFDVELAFSGEKMPVCEPREWNVPADAVRFEAEDLADPFFGGTLAVPREGASGGRILSGWTQPGRYANWDFTVPAAGKYRVWVRAAQLTAQTREVRIDGRPMGGNGFCVWNSTGGLGYTPGEWRWFEMPWTVELARGTHRLTITQMKNSNNLDELAVVPEKENGK